jgi:hypothetical protein
MVSSAMRGTTAAWILGGCLGLSPGACLVETTESGTSGTSPCGDRRCSVHGFCRDGECFCESGYLGDPYAERGCQQPPDSSACGTTCGLNAYCEGTECVCVEGFVACGTGDCIAPERVCDGVDDCPAGGDEDPQRCAADVEQLFVVTDGCDDGLDVQWRVWAEDRDWVWPGPDDAFVTPGFDVPTYQAISCIANELVCVGARAGDRVYGVDLDGSTACDDCCFACERATVDFGVLEC